MFGDNGPVSVELNSTPDSFGANSAAGHLTIPAELLFHGDYKRAGYDLKIVGHDGKEVVVYDYFKTDKPATLFAPDGAALTGDIVAALAGPLAPGQYAQATAPQSDAQPIGRVATESGGAVAIRNGVSVALNVGDAVLKGDVIQTQGDSKIGIIFGDGTTFDLGANARMVLNDFVYNPAPGSVNSALINLVQGSITFVAGAVAHTGDMKVGTPVATMGIRGTAVQVDIDVNNGATHMSVLVEPGGHVGSFNIYSLSGQLIGTVNNASNQWAVTPTAPLEAIATETLKTPAQLQQAFAAMTQVFQVQQVGQAILAAQPVPPSAPPQQTPQNLQGPDNQTPQQPTQTTPKTQITTTDVSTTHITVTQDTTTSAPQVTITKPDAEPETYVAPPPPPPPPIIIAPPNLAPFFEAAPTTLVRVAAADHDGNPLNAIGPAASADGRYVAFLGVNGTLTSGGNNLDVEGVFVYDRLTNTTVSISDKIIGTTLHAGETFESLPSISTDGHFIVFSGKYQAIHTQGENSFTYEARETFIYDSHTGVSTLLTANGGDPSISADGHYVAVVATSFVTTGSGESTTTVSNNVIDVIDRTTGATVDEISIGSADLTGGSQPHQGTEAPSLNSDGRYLTFDTSATSIDVTHDSTTTHLSLSGNGSTQVYLYDLQNPGTAPQLVSFASGGGAGNGNSGTDGPDESWASSMGVDAQGRLYVVFESSATNLVAGGTDGHSNIYLYRAADATHTASIQLISVDLTSTSSAHGDSIRPQISADGRYISYVSAASDLIANGADTNGQTDTFLYDTLTGSTTLVSNGYNGDSEWGTTVSSVNGAAVIGFGSQATNTNTEPVDNNSADVFVLDKTQLNSGSVSDDSTASTLTTTGILKFVDTDSTTHTVTTAAPGTHYGNLTAVVQSDSNSSSEGVIAWTYTVDESVAAALGLGKTLIDTFNVTVIDGAGNTALAVVTVSIVGGNGEISGTTSGSVVDDPSAPAGEVATGQLVVTTGFIAGLPLGLTWTVSTSAAASPTSVVGQFGALAIDQSGNWQYTLNDSLPAVQALGHGQSLIDTFAIEATNATGGIESKIITITVNGIDHAPTVTTSLLTAEVTQNAAVQSFTATGLLAALGAADADGDTLSIVNLALLDPNGNPINLNSPPAGVTVTLNPDGSLVSFSVDPANYKYLNDGQHVVLTANFSVSDGFGGLTPASAHLTVDGLNDVAVIGTPTVVDVTEDVAVNGSGNLTAVGSISISDVDQNQNSFQTTVTGTGNLGNLVLAAGGSYTYTVANSAVQYLGGSDTKTDTFTVTALDGTSKQVSFTIHGANDAPVAVADANAVTEDTAPNPVSGNVLTNDTDVDLTDAHTVSAVKGLAGNVGQDVAGTYGTLHLNADGSYSYTLANGQTNVQALAQGQQVTDVFAYTNSDNHGGTSSANLTITITGTNDAAVIGTPTVADVTEDTAVNGSGNLTAVGAISISDVDQNQNSFQTTVTGSGNLGNLVLAAGGSYTYTVANSAVQYLGGSDTKTDTFTVTALDGTSKQVSFTIHGANDVAVIGTPTVADVTEDTAVNGSGNLTAVGSISISDVDQNQNSFQTTVTGTGNLGNLVLAAGGSYTYTVANSAVQYLGGSDTKTDTFTVTALDGTSKQVSFTIHGANDVAVIGTPTVADVTEDVAVNGSGNLTAVGSISISDVDQNQNSFQTTVTGSGNLGNLVLAADGSYTYTVANSAVQYLGGSDTKTDTFTVTALDGTSKQVSFTIHGANDVAVIGTPTVADVTEDAAVNGSGNLTAVGSISISDVDQNQNSFQTTVTGTGNLGNLVLAAGGSYTYTVANSAVQYLGGSDTKTDTFTVTALDGTSKQVSFTIHGANDVAVIGTPTVADVTEDTAVNGSGNLTAVGSISISDVDQNQNSFQTTVTGSGNLGNLVLAAGGSYTYTVANSAVQYLGGSDTKTDTFTVTALDGTSKQVSFTIHGANDVAVIGTPTVADVTEDTAVNGSGNLTAVGSISISDVDQNQNSFQTTVTGTGNLGNLVLAAGGSYTYTVANSAVQYLGGSDTKTDTFTVTALDGTSKQVSFTIHGANDVAVIGTPTVADVTEDTAVNGSGNLTAVGSISISDVDQNQNSFQTTVTGSGNLGNLVLAAGGSYTYTVANSAVQYLGGSDTKTDTFTVTALDGTSKQVSFTIHGVNDPAVLSSATVNLDETNAPLTTGGTLTISDVDSPATFVAQNNVAGSYGHFSIGTNGAWSYTANSAFDSLNIGDTNSDTFQVSSADGTLTSVTVNIHGTDDAPVAVNDINAITAGQFEVDGNVLANDSDVDSALSTLHITNVVNDALLPDAFIVDGTYGEVVVTKSTGDYSYFLGFTPGQSAAVAALGQNVQAQDDFLYTVTDDHGVSANAHLTITVTGVNDPAVLSSATVNLDETNAPLTTGGTLTISDVDSPATFVAQNNVAGSYGHFSIGTNGAWSYTANSAFDSLNVGDTNSDTFQVASADGTLTSVTVNIHGTNDAPVLSSATADLAYTENQAATAIDPVLALSDVDNANLVGATVSISGNFVAAEDILGFTNQNGITGLYNSATGVLTLSGSSSLASYQAALRSITYFNSSDNPSGQTRTISFQVNDGSASNNLSNVSTATVSVTPVNDAPVIQNVSGTVPTSENVSVPLYAPIGIVTDVDASSSDLLLATLKVTSGRLTPYGDVLGLTIVNGLNGDNGTLSFTGTLDAITTAIHTGVTYTPTLNYVGSDQLTFTVDDQGHSGSGGSQTATATVGITVGSGTIFVENSDTVEIGASSALIANFIGAGGTLQTNGTITGGAAAGISATSTDGAAMAINAAAGVTSTGTDAIDATNSGGAGDISITANGTTTGALNGISATQIGSGKITIGGAGNITGQSGYGILAQQSATSLGGILINGSGNVTGTGASFDGILAQILNVNDGADVTVSQTGNVSGGHYGINAVTHGNGNVSVTTGANATITATAAGASFGIEAQSFGSGNVLVTTAIGDQINSASTGIHAENYATAVPQAAGSTVAVNSYGGINFGSVVPTGGHPRGILAWYSGDTTGAGTPNANVFGDVTVNNYADITQTYDGVGADAGDGIGAFNYGIGDVTINDGTLNNLGGQGTTINVARHGLLANSYSSGNTTVSTAAGDSISAGASGIVATDAATAIAASANSKITVTANGTINSGLNAAVNGNSAGIVAGYNGAPNLAVNGTVLVDNNANITAAAGWGIDAINSGKGDVTVHDTALKVSGAQTGIGAYQNSGGTGDVKVTVAAGSTVTGVAGDAIDANNNNGGSGDVSVTTGANATLTGGFHGIVAGSYGSGSILISTAAGDIVNAASRALFVFNSATAIAQAAGSTIEVDGYGAINFGSTLTAQGNRPRGIFAGYNGDASSTGTPNANVFGDITVNNYANITQTYNGVAADAGDGIAAFNQGVGNITITDGTLNNLGGQGTTINVARSGINANNYFSGDTTVSTAAGDSITAGGTGIFAENYATAIDASANSKITITADGTITSGQNAALNGGTAGILAAYTGAVNGPFVPDLAVNGTVLVNNNANITAAAGWGIDAFNYGNGDVTVHDTALTVSGAQTGIGAYQDGGGTGDVTVTVAAGSAVTGITGNAIEASVNNGGSGDVSVTTGANVTMTGGYSGIVASSSGPGSILISTAAGDTVNVASRALWAYNTATAISQAAASTIEVDAYGSLNFGSTLTAQGNRARGISAGYNGDASASGTPNANVFGDVTINNYANITQTYYDGIGAHAGDGIGAFNFGVGDITIADGTLNNVDGGPGTSICAARFGIFASNYFSGNTTVSMAAGDSITAGSSGMNVTNNASAILAFANSEITVTAKGTIDSGTIPNGNWSAGINAGYVGGISNPSNLPNTSVNGTVTVNNYANITDHNSTNTGDAGINTFNWGNGDIWIHDYAGAISATGTGINAVQLSGGTGNVHVEIDAGASVTGATGIFAQITGSGSADITNYGTVTSTQYSTFWLNLAAGASATIENYGTMISAGYMSVGEAANTTSTLTMSGASASLSITGASSGFAVGNYGTGYLTVENGATFTADFLNIGGNAGSHGTAIIDGAGTTLTTTAGTYQNILIGDQGTASLTVQNGATVQTTNMEVGGNGSLTVTGSGATVTTANLSSGAGTPTVSVSDGALLHAINLWGTPITIGDGGTFEVGTSDAPASVSFSDTSGTLILDTPASFGGYVVNVTTNAELLDLRGLSAISGDTFSASATYNSGTTLLTVTDWTKSTSASVTLSGDYSTANGFAWTASYDNAGGIDAALDHAPVLTLPGNNASTNKFTSLPLKGGQVSDVETDDVITLNLSVAHGKLTPIDTVLPAGITVDDGDGTDGTLQVHGSATAISTLLTDGVTYTPNNGFAGVDTMTVAVHDAAGAGDLKQVAIDVIDTAALSVNVAVVTTNGAVQEGQQLQATSTITGDSSDLTQTVNYVWQSSSDNGVTWTNIDPSLVTTSGTSSFYQLTEADEGKLFRAQGLFTDDVGNVISGRSAATVPVADVAPIIIAPFSYAVDELSITKNGNPFYDDTFGQAPPYSPQAGNPASPVTFLTLGSTWTEAGGKAILSSSGATHLAVGEGVVARLTTNTDPTLTNGLKQGAAFTASAKFDLVVPSIGGGYGMEFTDATATHAADQLVEIRVDNIGGTIYVDLYNADFTLASPFTLLASQALTAQQLSGNTQIQFDLLHAINSTAITGSFELLNDGTQTSQTVFSTQGTLFRGSSDSVHPNDPVNWTRVELIGYANTAPLISGVPELGQTLTASAATNDVDATLHYVWQESPDGGATWGSIAGSTDSNHYVVQQSDVGDIIRVHAYTTDPDSSQTASANSAATHAVYATPSVSASPAHLVEATSANPGVSSSSAALQFAGGSAPVHVATGAMAGDGWVQAGNPPGVYTQNGTYGTAIVDINANTISYALDNTKADPLGASDHPTETFSIPVTDGVAVGTSNVVFTVDGSNDAPNINTTQGLSFENGLSAHWQIDGTAAQVLGGTDGLHAAQLQTGTVSASAIESFLNIPYNTLASINTGPPGASTTPVDGSAISTDTFLQAGQVLTFDWRFTTDDYHPWDDFAFFSASLTLASGTATELSNVYAVGDYGDSGWHTGSFIAPTAGFYHIGFGVMNGGDGEVMSTLQVDNVVTGGGQSMSITEGVSVTGVETDTQILTFSDPEIAQTHTVSDPVFIGSDYGQQLGTLTSNQEFGSLTANLTSDTVNGQNGQITFNFSVNDSDIQFLGAGQQVHEQYQFSLSDGNGGVTTQTVTVTITGADDGGVNLVQNGGFETGDLWASHTGNVAVVNDYSQHDGILDATVGGAGQFSSLAQSVATTPGDHYTLDFWLANNYGGANDFTVLWNGEAVTGGAISQPEHTAYTEYQFDVVGAANSTSTSFEFDVSGASTAWNLDDVSVRSGAPDAVHQLASDTLALSGVEANDTLNVVENGSGYRGTLSAAAPANGTVAWAFDANNADINLLSGQTQYYTVNDLNGNQPPTAVSVSIGGAGNDQFVFDAHDTAHTGVHEMVEFSVLTNQSGTYVGDTIELLNFSQTELNNALAGLASDTHGNATVNFDNGDSITFQHLSASIIQAQAGNMFHVGGGGGGSA